LWEAGGITYVYLTYGMHWLLNVVTSIKGNPEAVLIRAIEPSSNINIMRKNRQKKKQLKTLCNEELTNGPAKLTQALKISGKENALSLQGERLFISEGIPISKQDILSSPRVGVEYAKEDANKPWRFYIKNNAWVSR
jgi:DNA-3-methyladenine glycosylase